MPSPNRRPGDDPAIELVPVAPEDVGLAPPKLDAHGRPVMPQKSGWLQRGLPRGSSSPGSGRTPSHIRRALMASFEERIHIFNDIVDGKPIERCVHLCSKCGTKTKGWMSASIGEVAKVLEVMGKYSIGTTTTLTDKDGNNLPVAGGYDFGKLDQIEMDQLEVLLNKAKLR